ncbi:MAG: hypothetical protein AAF281_01000 [Pseudomonadota bacterium]
MHNRCEAAGAKPKSVAQDQLALTSIRAVLERTSQLVRMAEELRGIAAETQSEAAELRRTAQHLRQS